MERPQEHFLNAERADIAHNTFISDIEKNIEKATNDFVVYLNSSLFPTNFST
jgi:hypothetical protein